MSLATKIVVGIDVSKDKLDIAISESPFLPSSKAKMLQIENKVSAIRSFLKNYDKSTSSFAFEPTGSYSDKLAYCLSKGGYTFSYVNPRQSHHYGKVLGILHETDKSAARLLGCMSSMLALPQGNYPTKDERHRQQLLGTLTALEKQERALLNQLHALEQYVEVHKIVKESLQEMIGVVKEQIIKLKKELQVLSKKSHSKTRTLLLSIQGIGDKTADWLLHVAGDFRKFDNVKQFLSFLGLAPTYKESGSSVYKKGGITKRGHSQLRACLFMGTRAARRYNHACQYLWKRLTEKGKCYHKKVVALMCKLAKQAFGVVKSEIPFDNDHYLKFEKK